MPPKNRKKNTTSPLAESAAEGAALFEPTAAASSRRGTTSTLVPLGKAAGAATIREILRTTDEYALQVFPEDLIGRLEITTRDGKHYLNCLVRKTEKRANPEEIIRQLYILTLVHKYHYPLERLRVEKDIHIGSTVHDKAADIVVMAADNPDADQIIVETKKPKRKDGIEQLKSYCNATGSPVGVWTNGKEIVRLHREDPNIFRSLPDIPAEGETLDELLAQRWTLDDLARVNRLVRDRITLKSVILTMENLVLAHAGVDAFDEVFKLIYSKLYDEWYAAQASDRRPRYLQFRVGGCTPAEFYEKIDRLFHDAKDQWPGVFEDSETIKLTPPHLLTCGSFLEDIKLFNSNLQIIDEAFEYLSTDVAKGRKGQFFTPRHVIDMCVAMLNPTNDEFVIDTAAGSCGFTVHSIFHVWGNEFTAEGPTEKQKEYARTKVFGIDFDAKSVKIAKALNLIAGDGKSNVYRSNTLDTREWPEEVRAGFRPRLRRFRDRDQQKRNQAEFIEFEFDVLLTNPPFAGEIKDHQLLYRYDLAKKAKGRGYQKSMGRDVLFIERNLQFLRPGGRMCIVLPQSRLNNVSDAHIRAYIEKHARILACVSLHVNTFKPHANIKTSVMFLQKWNDDEDAGPICPTVEDYPIFFAISEQAGKDSSGDYLFRLGTNGVPELDSHGHMIPKHDLAEVVSAFEKFARKEGLSFVAVED